MTKAPIDLKVYQGLMFFVYDSNIGLLYCFLYEYRIFLITHLIFEEVHMLIVTQHSVA